MGHGGGNEASSLRHALSVVRRQWVMILLATMVAPWIAVLFAINEEPQYESSAEVLLSYQNLAGSLTGTIDNSVFRDPQRIAETQARLARVPEVAKATIEATPGATKTADELLASSSVTPSSSSDVLSFQVVADEPEAAQQLATRYAQQFIAYKLRLDTGAIAQARAELQSRIRELRAAGAGEEQLIGSLTDKDQTLQTLQSLQTSNALLIQGGSEGEKISPNPQRNAVVGLGLGLLVGLGLAFLRETLDTRVRDGEEVGERLGLTLLARLPEPPRRMRAPGHLVMLDDGTGPHAEAFRILRTNLEFVGDGKVMRVLAVTSAINGEGKSTTAANLAAAFALSGNRVILVDLDLRQPTAHTFFDAPSRPGVTDVVLRGAKLDEALVAIPLGDENRGLRSAGPANGGAPASAHAELSLLPSGPLPMDAGELSGSRGLGDLLAELRDRADLVIVDTAPMLRVGDTMALSVFVDALVVVARTNVVSRPMLTEMARTLRRVRAHKLGVVLTGTSVGDAYGGGYYGHATTEEAEAEPGARTTT